MTKTTSHEPEIIGFSSKNIRRSIKKSQALIGENRVYSDDIPALRKSFKSKQNCAPSKEKGYQHNTWRYREFSVQAVKSFEKPIIIKSFFVQNNKN